MDRTPWRSDRFLHSIVIIWDWDGRLASWIYGERVSGGILSWNASNTSLGGTSVGFELSFDEPHLHLAAVAASSRVFPSNYIVRIGEPPQ